MLILMWLVGPQINAAFDSWTWPLLDIIFLPYMTIMYVLVWSPATGLAGWDGVWGGLGVVLDIVKCSQIANNRKRIPG